MKKTYKTRGTCSQMIEIETEDGVIRHIQFIGGCSGNTQGVARLAEGRRVEEVIPLIRGIRCGMKPTSCPDQLARALEEMVSEGPSK